MASRQITVQLMRRGVGLSGNGAAKQLLLRGGGGGGPPRPPFIRTLAPQGSLHEEHELVWDDGVAAETCIDFDAPHISSSEGFAWWIGGFLFFLGVGTVALLRDPDAQNPTTPRGPTMPFGGLQIELGGDPSKISKVSDAVEEDVDEDDEEEEDDE
eukprot:CAMPEP_0185774868 /NCGR_PEP_ID=MMETSP1174-20130828/80270_1 /TAXON_ID=35687 /ORGANISM="Dictyocha speculum, Strain CCMP1381" /LENGTH=155 /DNA_ID=CAMNT_0028462251 /DNA_START=42 /DNA_END=509 /DNA_ORIENTATION=+